MNSHIARRTILRGAGVALALPWLESLAPKLAFAQDALRRRFLPIYLPNGAPELWAPSGKGGAGSAWQLSSVQQPLQALKSKIIVLTNLENASSFSADANPVVEPSHGRQPGAWLTCVDPGVIRKQQGVKEANAISVDQTIANSSKAVGNTPIKSMQVGLSTWYSYCDSEPCSNSRSVSWNASGKPMYKSVDPLEVFNKLVGVTSSSSTNTTGMPDAQAQRRVALNQSVLDAVLENATRTQARLGARDKASMQEFLDSVRAVEKQATALSTGMGGLACMAIGKPTMAQVLPNKAKQNTATYNKGTHADVMNDLIVMAFQCDATRIISYMLEDERSEFAYSHVTRRTFTAAGSTETSGTCPEYHNGGQHGTQNDFASITWWNVGKVAALCSKLDAIKEGNGTLLDNCVVLFGSSMHGSNHYCNQLPTMLIGGGAGRLKTDQHVVADKRWLRDLHYTVMKDVFGLSGDGVDNFGTVRSGNPVASIKEILSG